MKGSGPATQYDHMEPLLMMRFAKLSMLSCLFALSFGAHATLIPFQVVGSDLEVDFDNGFALGGYEQNSMAEPVYLAEGEGFGFNFGTVKVPFGVGSGTGTLTVTLATPDADGSVSDGASFSIISFFVGLVEVDWGAPQYFDYSHAGAEGGVFRLDMADLDDQAFKVEFDLVGTITNLRSPIVAVRSVPEPAPIALLGLGLIALSFLGLRRAS